MIMDPTAVLLWYCRCVAHLY